MIFSTEAPLTCRDSFSAGLHLQPCRARKSPHQHVQLPHARLWGVDETSARWTGGFWRGRFDVCWESSAPDGVRIDDVIIPADMKFRPETIVMGGCEISSLVGESDRLFETACSGSLYSEPDTARRKVSVRLIPYFAFGNCGHSEMTVWMPLGRN